MSADDYSLIHRGTYSYYVFHGKKFKAALWGLFYKDTNPIYEGSVSGPSHFLKTSLASIVTLGVRIPAYESMGNIDIGSIAKGALVRVQVASKYRCSFKQEKNPLRGFWEFTDLLGKKDSHIQSNRSQNIVLSYITELAQ